MHSQSIKSEEKTVKHALFNGMRTQSVKQEIVAQVLGVNQSSVSRMVNPEEDLHLSVAGLSMLHKDPFTAAVADDVIESIAARFVSTADADGDFLDEFFELTSIDGNLSNIIKDGVQHHEHKKILKLASRLEDIAGRLRSEVNKAKSK